MMRKIIMIGAHGGSVQYVHCTLYSVQYTVYSDHCILPVFIYVFVSTLSLCLHLSLALSLSLPFILYCHMRPICWKLIDTSL